MKVRHTASGVEYVVVRKNGLGSLWVLKSMDGTINKMVKETTITSDYTVIEQ